MGEALRVAPVALGLRHLATVPIAAQRMSSVMSALRYEANYRVRPQSRPSTS
jgi:hypothetical protein